jgi:hypothetical protein
MKRETPKNRSRKPWWEMNTAELAKATAKYDRPFAAMNEAKPLTARDKKLFAKARRRGRPQIGDGADRVLISIERKLLKRADEFATLHGLKRSELIAKALTRMMLPDRKKASA